jgi:hypothetical protein
LGGDVTSFGAVVASALMMETAGPSVSSVHIYETTRRYFMSTAAGTNRIVVSELDVEGGCVSFTVRSQHFLESCEEYYKSLERFSPIHRLGF